jgi:soluble lytic murein transglycosylase-like protein
VKKLILAAALAATSLAAHAAPSPNVPRQLDDAQAAGYRSVFAAIRAGRWDDARLALAAMPPGPLHVIARAELLTAKNSPRAEAAELVDVLNAGPELPQAEQIARMARTRGAVDLPPLPSAQSLTWVSGAPVRARAKTISTDSAAIALALQMSQYVKTDNGEAAQALLEQTAPTLTPEALTEWRHKVAFIYYVSGNDAAARPLAQLAANGVGDWAVQARWTLGLIAWRQRDYTTAGQAFEAVATRSSDTEMRAAGLYWAARADLAAGRPNLIEGRLKNAAQLDETFYGLLARQALAIRDPKNSVDAPGGDAWRQLAQRPNIRVAAALTEIGEDELADEVIRQQAKIGDPADYAALTQFAGQIGLPAAQLWMSNNVPRGVRPSLAARYPSPAWVPDGGWRVDKALVFAHTLQESRFRTGVVSQAGAYGLMQIMPASAIDFTRATGIALDKTALTKPSVNIAVGQDKLLRLRDMGATGGLLPKVIAAYNAGPGPVINWNAESRDGGDPLLYIESIPYWETRGYVGTVLRNYWMYERQAGRASSSRAALAQGLWPRFPGMAGASAVRLQTAVAPPRFNPLPLPQAQPQITFDPSVIAASSGSTIIGSR